MPYKFNNAQVGQFHSGNPGGGGDTVRDGICDVCRILDGDTSIKMVQYCSECDANLCQRDRLNYFRRARAFAKRHF